MRIMGIFLLVFFISCGDGSPGTKDIIIADFEDETYGEWQAIGEIFTPGPSRAAREGQRKVTGFIGRGFANTFYTGDDLTGSLTSPAFKIERRFINFLMGGGYHPDEVCLNLLVEGKTVRTATGPYKRGKAFEAMDWQSWNVSELTGRTARLQIIDKKKGSWANISVDQIVQSDMSAVSSVLNREMTFNKSYLNLPVKHGGPMRLLNVTVDGKTVREFEIELADNEPDYRVWLDIDEFQGKEALLTVNTLPSKSSGLSAIDQADQIADSATFYREANRQQFHFSSIRGWNNDPNGMVFHDGEYHLFYQHNPFGWHWGNMTWGHAVSTDSVHWTELGDAIHPDHLGTIFSGSAVIDHNNTAGFQTGTEKVLVCAYTSAGGTNDLSEGQPFTQSIAYSNDRGRTWTVYEGNPVVEHINGSNRDPKVFWYEPIGEWVMVLYLDNQRMGFFSSPDLKKWTLNSEQKCFHECPELFELPVDGDMDDTRWVLYGASGHYLIGTFDGREFKPESEGIRFHSGNCFYASQTFNNMPASDPRRIQIAWGQINTPGMPFNQCMLFPNSLSLKTTDEGIRLFAEPIAEIKNIHADVHNWSDISIKPGPFPLSDLSGELFHIRGEFQLGKEARMSLNIRGTEVIYDAEKGQISCLDRSAPLKGENGHVTLEILVDRNSIEIFGNSGRVYMPIGKILPESEKKIEIINHRGDVSIIQLDIYQLKSIWKKYP